MSKYVGFKIGKVHEEHIESEYYCGGCGWPVTDHDSYCPECGGAFQKSFADDALEAENAKLREQIERLVTLLRVDCDIDASWDGLRRFWSIELTESGCLMRDRACKAEAENAKLRELVKDALINLSAWMGYGHPEWMIEAASELGIEVDE